MWLVAKKKRTGPSGGGTPAVVALEKAGVDHVLKAYEHDASRDDFGAEAVDALGLPPEQVFKTLLADVDGALAVGIVPVYRKLDLKALARAVGGKKAAMADIARAERATGYVAGGISPLGQKQRHATVLDESAEAFDVVYVSGGRRGLEVGLSPKDLLALTNGSPAPIAR
ncbi:Cys-tRNA(Pro) deacylase [Myceligenerans xiligouense]|uniref:Cys-tRNA(Pro)/Cys-tRNA(Cys) deacylase n=1 Tax=Myceligenerans xiligouense TaxID=253184 RepID=A0A3N4YLV9_9MICO|nr:Cys-tRNA(Pro) deacylase [Myceligenerans xiligouense]RPF20304.1 Cys-tRNA(Pro)/Cys-tRNA(Cys) deacylase [Myceligenerans xiligouense]